MTTTGLTNLDRAINTLHIWLSALEDELRFEDRAQTYRALEATLCSLRDQLTIEQSAHLSAQLPLIVRGAFFNGWQPSRVPVNDRSLEGFLDHVRQGLEHGPGSEKVDPLRVTRAVFGVLQEFIAPGLIEKIRGGLHGSIAAVWPNPSEDSEGRQHLH
ncbi:DUF2267 domain-containing protein [Lujinxingia sediminis]|nr:DUF2267 domain-containing protein [Lujinxingia sediminis]